MLFPQSNRDIIRSSYSDEKKNENYFVYKHFGVSNRGEKVKMRIGTSSEVVSIFSNIRKGPNRALHTVREEKVAHSFFLSY